MRRYFGNHSCSTMLVIFVIFLMGSSIAVAADFDKPPIFKSAPGHINTGSQQGSCLADKIIGQTRVGSQSVYSGDMLYGTISWTTETTDIQGNRITQEHSYTGWYGVEKSENGSISYRPCLRNVKLNNPKKEKSGLPGKRRKYSDYAK